MTQAINVAAAALRDSTSRREAQSLLLRRANRVGMRLTKGEARRLISIAVRNK